MAKGRELKGRIRSFENTRKITRTMEMVATSKMKRAQDRVVAARPYAAALRDVIGNLYSADLAERFPLLRQPTTVHRAAVARADVQSWPRWCVQRESHSRGAHRRSSGWSVKASRSSCMWSGRKGVGYFRYVGRAMASMRTDTADRPTVEDAADADRRARRGRLPSAARCRLCRIRAIRVRALDAADGRSAPASHPAESLRRQSPEAGAARSGAVRAATRLHPRAVGRGDSGAAPARLRPQQRVSGAGRDGCGRAGCAAHGDEERNRQRERRHQRTAPAIQSGASGTDHARDRRNRRRRCRARQLGETDTWQQTENPAAVHQRSAWCR